MLMSPAPGSRPGIIPEQLLDNLAEIALQIQQETEVQAVFALVVTQCRTQLQADRVIIGRFLPEAGAIVWAESVGAEWPPLLGQQFANIDTTVDWVNRYLEQPWKHIIHDRDQAADARWRSHSPAFQVQAYLGVPILVQGQLWGILMAHHCRRRNRTWQRVEAQFLQQVALHLGARVQLLTAQQTAEISVRQYERIISATPDCVALIDSHYIYQVINQTYIRWNHKTANEILGHSVQDLLGAALFQEIKPQLDRALGGETSSWQGWFTYPGRGRQFVRATYTPYVEPDGTISGVVVNVHDLTDLKRAENTLAASEERFRQMAANIREVFWMADIEFKQILYVSPAYEKIWGRSCASLYTQPKSFLQSVHPDDLAHVLANVEHQRQNGFSHEYRIVQPDGSIRWIWEQAFPVSNDMGYPHRLVGISQDITDRKAAEATLRLSEEQRRLALDLNQLGSWDSNPITGELVWSEQTFAIMGFAPDDPSYVRWRDRVLPEDLKTLEAAIQYAQKHRTYFNCEYRLRHPNGSIHWILVRGQTLHDETDRPIRMIGIVMDVSDRKQLEIALQQSEERYRQIVETATEGIWILDANHATTFVNPCMTTMLGYSEAEMLGKSLFDFMDEDGKAIAAKLIERRRQGIGEQHDFKFQHKDGSDVWTLISSRPLQDDAGRYAGVLGMLADITQRKLAELALQQQTQQEQALKRVFQAIRNSLDLDTIFATATAETANLLKVERVNIFQYVPVGQCWRPVSSYYRDGEPDIPGLVIPAAEQLFSEQLQQGTYVRVEETLPVPDQMHHPVAQVLPGAWLLVPLMHQEQLWGSLVVNSTQHPFVWSDNQIALVQAVADQLAIAIQQASLYRQTQLELKERQRAEAALQHLNQQLEQRVYDRTQALKQQAELERLLRLSIQNIHQSLDLKEILATVLQETRRTLQTDRMAIYQFDANWSGHFIAESVAEGWVPLVGEGIQTVWPDTYLQDNQGGRYRTNEILVVDDIYAAGLSDCHIAILEQFQVKAYATLPIFVDDQLWGVLAAYQNSASRQWRTWEMKLLRQISLQLAIALRQAQLYQTAQMQVQELEKLHQLKDDFLSTVSHELRSPLTNIKMAIQMIELNLHQQQIQDDRLTQYLQILKNSCQQELTLINDLLDLQRLEAGMQLIEIESIDLNHWLPAIVEPFATRAQEQNQHIVLELPPNLPTMTTDLISFKRIVMELLHNACKYTPPEQQITLAVQLCHEMLHLQFSNPTTDLSPDELPRLFEKFYRVPGGDPWKHGGTGLGLALVKRLIEHLQGSITVTSEQGLICFTIQLPIHLSFKNSGH